MLFVVLRPRLQNSGQLFDGPGGEHHRLVIHQIVDVHSIAIDHFGRLHIARSQHKFRVL